VEVLSKYISALIITILGMAALILKIIVLAPAFFEFGDAMNDTAYDLLSGAILTKWDNNYAMGNNVFWGFMFILIIGVAIYLYTFANRKEYVVSYA